MSVDHYENFPVASILLPPRLREAVVTLYQFARGADDAADEGEIDPLSRHAALQRYRDGLDAIRAGQPGGDSRMLGELAPLFERLGAVIRAHRLSLQPFYDLLSAFDQDVDVKRYADFVALRDYTRRSADPVGRLMLELFEAATPRNIADSDAICTALQLINFWQDVAIDWAKGRVYLPADAMREHGVTEAQVSLGRVDAAWRSLLGAEIARARTMMHVGAPLARRLGGRFGFELRLVVQGGLRILDKIETNDYDVFRRRSTLGRRDAPLLLWRALRMRD